MTAAPRSLAFVDLETTGLGPGTHRIAEIAVVTLERGQVEEWHTLVNPGGLSHEQRAVEGVSDEELAAAPKFAELAVGLKQRLEGRLLVAHNARFDSAFLKAEFARAGIEFEPAALCTVMLSRKLYPAGDAHNLDALMHRHGLTAEVRHRALPDARLLLQFWQVVTADFSPRRVWATIGKLLAEPLLPPHLDLNLIQALPEKCGVYTLRSEDGRALRIARAANLRREVRDYFRLDRISGKGARISYEVRHIDWQVADGDLSAKLLEIKLNAKEADCKGAESPCSIRLDPAAPGLVATVVPAAELVARSEALFGLFPSERKAKNALAKMAERENLCGRLLGVERTACVDCNAEHCARTRPQHLMRALTALARLRMPPWPYPGPVGVREGRTVHVFDQWQPLGSAKTAGEVADLALLRPNGFDHAAYRLLVRALPKISPRRLKKLRLKTSARAASAHDDPARFF